MLLPGKVKSSARVLHIKYLFIFSLRFLHNKGTFIRLSQIKSFCKIIFGSVSDKTLVELENSAH